MGISRPQKTRLPQLKKVLFVEPLSLNRFIPLASELILNLFSSTERPLKSLVETIFAVVELSGSESRQVWQKGFQAWSLMKMAVLADSLQKAEILDTFFFYLYAAPILTANLGDCCKVGLNKYKKGKKSNTENVTSWGEI